MFCTSLIWIVLLTSNGCNDDDLNVSCALSSSSSSFRWCWLVICGVSCAYGIGYVWFFFFLSQIFFRKKCCLICSSNEIQVVSFLLCLIFQGKVHGYVHILFTARPGSCTHLATYWRSNLKPCE